MPYIKSIVEKHTMKFSNQDVPVTLQNVRKHVIQSIGQDVDDYSILEEHNTTGSKFRCSLAFQQVCTQGLEAFLKSFNDWEGFTRKPGKFTEGTTGPTTCMPTSPRRFARVNEKGRRQ